MSHAEALQTLHPAVGATEAIVDFVSELRHAALSDEVRHYARRHLLDTVGVMIAGAGGEVASRTEAVLLAVRPAGRIPVPGQGFWSALAWPSNLTARIRFMAKGITTRGRRWWR